MTRADARLDDAIDALEELLSGPARRDIVARLSDARDLPSALEQLRAPMRSHRWPAGPAGRLDRLVPAFDARARAGGFHILHDWDGRADRVNADSIPVDLLNFIAGQRAGAPATAAVLAILLDYYFFYFLALLSVRVWDAGDPDDALQRIDGLLQHLQGPSGSGQRFVDRAETLLLIVGSHFEPKEEGFDRLLAQVRTLGVEAQRRTALDHASSLGCHLRFGFEVTYGRDLTRLRHDNVADYPWLCFSLVVLLKWYDELIASGATAPRRTIAEAILNGLTSDADALLSDATPDALRTHAEEREDVRVLLHTHRRALVDDAAQCRPLDGAYSPMCLFFNFSQNALKGLVIDAALYGEPSAASLSDLLTSTSPDDEAAGRGRLAAARMLTGYARANPDPIRGRWLPALFYDHPIGRRTFRAVLQRLDAI